MKKLSLLAIVTLYFYPLAQSQIFTPDNKIVCYFTHRVDNSVARSQKAIALLRIAGDTLIQYINRAKYSLDIALYDYVEDSTWYEGGYVPPIHTAINNAYARGVKIRWICNTIDSNLGFTSSITPNYGLALINKNIPILQSPTGGGYGIMHNKFIVIDGRASNPDAPIVWTGSMNWEPGQIAKDENNIIIVQDSGVAHAYLTEFNQMWGDSAAGGNPNLSQSKFGPNKQNITIHNFKVGANQIPVEVYFSPSDQTNNHILSTMELAKSEIDVSMFTFTDAEDATQMVSEQNHNGIYVTCLVDQSSLGYSAYPILSAGNGLDTLLQTYTVPITNGVPQSIDHNKFMIVDPCNLQSNPTVLTGSHNWSLSANTANDENTIIIHDSTVANLYYQAYRRTFMDAQDTTTNHYHPHPFPITQHCEPLGINDLKREENLMVYPNPANKELSVLLNFQGNNIRYNIYNILGEQVITGKFQHSDANQINISSLPAGIYMIAVQSGKDRFTEKFSKE